MFSGKKVLGTVLGTIGKPDPVSGEGSDDPEGAIIRIINFIIGALGLVAVIVISLGGVQYMTSAGDSGKVKKAKDTILYGVIGLVVCILAAAIVNFVIGAFNGQQQGSGGGGGQATTAGFCKVYDEATHSYTRIAGVTPEYCDDALNGQWERE